MMRSSHWAHRARAEFERSACTWLGTITLTPFQHMRLDAAVAAKAQKTGAFVQTEWKPEDYFRERCEVFGRWISLWLKRVRVKEQRRRGKGSQAPDFSYLLVAEMHRSGRPHWHVLVHEPRPYELIRADEYYVTRKGVVRVDDAAMVRKTWQLGFTQFELCRDSRSASYLCKYLAKDMLWRVRASQKYGGDCVTALSGVESEVSPPRQSSGRTPRSASESEHGQPDEGLASGSSASVRRGRRSPPVSMERSDNATNV